MVPARGAWISLSWIALAAILTSAWRISIWALASSRSCLATAPDSTAILIRSKLARARLNAARAEAEGLRIVAIPADGIETAETITASDRVQEKRGTGSVAARATAFRSTRRHTARATCADAPASLPPIDPVFIEAVRTGDASAIRSPYLDGLKSLDVTLAMNKSAETGRPEKPHFAG